MESKSYVDALPRAQRDCEEIQRRWEALGSVSREEAGKIARMDEANKKLLSDLSEAQRQFQETQRLVSSKQHLIDQATGEVMRAKVHLRRAETEFATKQLHIRDSIKTLEHTTRSLKDLEAVYQVLKNDRNKCSSQIQQAAQRQVEMREKIRILMNETEILRSSVLEKEAKLQRRRLDNQTSSRARDNLMGELNQLKLREAELRTSKKRINAENKKQLDIIEVAEARMIQLREEYAKCVQERNDLGVSLIDRHDELVTFYEKVNIQDQMLRNGEMELRAREDEIRFLKLEVQDLKRDIMLRERLQPEKRDTEQELMDLQIALVAARKKVSELEHTLETPENNKKVRRLQGTDPSQFDLKQRMEELSARLVSKEERALERTLVLEETSKLVKRAERQVDANKADTVKLAKQVNDYQARLKDITRKMMAMVSELSMYQASVLQLQQEAHEKALEVEQADARLEDGLPPTEDVG